MFCRYKNLYLQLECAVNPRIIDRSVEAAHSGLRDGSGEAEPPRLLLRSAQPSLFAPWVDITRARLGFGRIGLRKLARELHDEDPLVQLQAIHTLLDQVQIPESALYLIGRHTVHRLVDLMLHENPVTREKICLILTHIAKLYQGRKAIHTREQILYNLLIMIVKDQKKEIRYAAAFTLMTVSRDRCSVELVLKVENIIPALLEKVRHDYVGIALLHLKTLENLLEWDQENALLNEGFETMKSLFHHKDPRVAVGVLDCMRQLLKHPHARIKADEHDMVFVLHDLLSHRHVEVIISAAGAMQYATLTTRSRWRAKERCVSLSQKLVDLCYTFNKPPLQLFCLKILINLCEMPDIRAYARAHLLLRVRGIKLRTHEQWDGTTETSCYGLETGHNYRSMCIEGTETVRNDGGEDVRAVNVHSYLLTLNRLKRDLILAIKKKPYP